VRITFNCAILPGNTVRVWLDGLKTAHITVRAWLCRDSVFGKSARADRFIRLCQTGQCFRSGCQASWQLV